MLPTKGVHNHQILYQSEVVVRCGKKDLVLKAHRSNPDVILGDRSTFQPQSICYYSILFSSLNRTGKYLTLLNKDMHG